MLLAVVVMPDSEMCRIMVVEDFRPFRRLLVSWLLAERSVNEVFECSDGLSAVERALELKPDIVTMDIGLPHLNGIEAARHIHQVLPEAKILFVSQENSPDILDEAESTGAWGYIHKARACRDLPAGIAAISQGKIGRSAFRPLSYIE